MTQALTPLKLHACSFLGGFVIVSYFEQLATLAHTAGVDLKRAFAEAGVPDSTYYRARLGQDLQARTARRVALQLAGTHEQPLAAE